MLFVLLCLFDEYAITCPRYRTQEYDTHRDPRGPFSAGAEVVYGTISGFITSLRGMPSDIFSSTRQSARSQAQGTMQAHDAPVNDQSDDHGESASDSGQDEIPDNPNITNGTDVTRTITTTCTRESSLRRSEILSDAGYRAGQWAKHVLDWVIMIPGDVTLSLSRGFHNAPRLYHDHMVGPLPKVMGIRTGFQAAGKVSLTLFIETSTFFILIPQEFTDGFYQGITGLVTQPHQGAKKSGSMGLLKGVGKGIGGIIVKPAAGMFSQSCSLVKSRACPY